GGALTRLAFRNSNSKVIYTAHGFHFFKGGPVKNWILFYPIERFLSRYTDILLTINNEDFQVAKTFHAKNVIKIPGVGIKEIDK
ncbi:glycosyltransferase family 1 protein, partial [Enterococcus faecalis]